MAHPCYYHYYHKLFFLPQFQTTPLFTLALIDDKTNIDDRMLVTVVIFPLNPPLPQCWLILTSCPAAASCKFQFQSKSQFETDHFLTLPLWHRFSLITKNNCKIVQLATNKMLKRKISLNQIREKCSFEFSSLNLMLLFCIFRECFLDCSMFI